MTVKVGLAPPTNFWTLDADARREIVARSDADVVTAAGEINRFLR